VRNVLLEALLIGAAGLAIAAAANTLSPRGLRLTRNYSPGGALTASQSIPATGTNALAAAQFLAAQFRSEGLQLANSNLVATLFADPKKGLDLVVFIDARDDDHYQSGHIPGAYQLDHYHPENYLATALPVCQAAEKILVYCKGGSCEDSEQTAIFLRDAGVPGDKLFVYAGGFDEWTANYQPVETGSRNSGQLQPAKPPPEGAHVK
jgi:rhodanese-related sulfurtransferase